MDLHTNPAITAIAKALFEWHAERNITPGVLDTENLAADVFELAHDRKPVDVEAEFAGIIALTAERAETARARTLGMIQTLTGRNASALPGNYFDDWTPANWLAADLGEFLYKLQALVPRLDAMADQYAANGGGGSAEAVRLDHAAGSVRRALADLTALQTELQASNLTKPEGRAS